eukprot:TRINITY_DN1872_c0_g1_i1.p1 TRINITY_DN1872_c0_g1~~TRINITY_DN1872_c0_g1_i1.p1  ORF type:complete len:317 (-),score=105.76 TRINITY_DN1872_c0_g1_i1:61-1011(-)
MNPQQFFRGLIDEVVSEIASKYFENEEEILELSAAQQTNELAGDVMATSVDHILSKCKKATLMLLMKEYVDDDEDSESNITLQAMRDLLHSIFMEKGIDASLSVLSLDVIRDVGKSLRVETECDKDTLLGNINNKSFEVALEKFFTVHFNDRDLKKWIETIHDVKVLSSSKKRLVKVLLTGQDESPKPRSRPPPTSDKVSKEKPDIKAGIVKEDLDYWYYVKDLKSFCLDNEVTMEGTKKNDLIHSILAHLSEDPEEYRKKRKREEEEEAAAKKQKLEEEAAMYEEMHSSESNEGESYEASGASDISLDGSLEDDE